MNNLLKLATLGLVAYGVYELVQNRQAIRQRWQGPVTQGFGALGLGRTEPSRERESRTADARSPVIGTSSPQGMRVETADPDGASSSELVGRGVVTR